MTERPVKLAFGERYSDNSGWAWLIEAEYTADGWRVRGDGHLEGLHFDPVHSTGDLEQIGRAFIAIQQHLDDLPRDVEP